MAQSSFTQTLSQLESTLDEYFGKKAPAMPTNIKEVLVKIAPYLVLLSIVFSIPAILALLSFGNMFTVMAPPYGVRMAANVWIATALLIPVLILEIMALPGLFKKTKIAWKYMFWAQFISLIATLFQMNLIGFVIGGAIGMYILFQVRSLYK